MSKKSEPTVVFSYVIYGDCASQKNNKRIIYNKKTKKPMIISSKKATEWRKNALSQMMADRLPKLKLDMPLNAKIIIYRKNRRGGAGDLNNFLQAPLDVLVEYGIIADDNRDIIYSVDGSRLEFDKENPRVEIELSLVE